MKGIKGHYKHGRKPKSPHKSRPQFNLIEMLKRFYLLSFALAFLSIGVVAQPLTLTENFQFNNDCNDPPQIIHDDANYWQYTFSSTVTTNKPLYNHYIWRYITLEFYKVVGNVNTLEWTYDMPYSRVLYLNNTFSFDTNDMPNLPSGEYQVYMHVRYVNGSGVPSGNMNMTVLKDGSITCPLQDFSVDGEVECDLGHMACFDYQSCFTLSVGTSKFGNTVSANISGGSGNYTISWFVEEDPTGATYNHYNTTSVPKRCGTFIYWATVTDNVTGCVRQDVRTISRLCAFDLPIDRVGGRFGEETSPSFSIFPNPTSNGTVQIQYELPQGAAQAQLSLYNTQGQLVQSIELNLMSNEQKIRLENLSKGVYVANLELDGQRLSSQKLVIQ